MPIKLTPGKIDGLTAVADERGVIAALALDQRGLLKNMIAMELGEDTSEQDYYCPTSAKVKSPYSCPTPGRGKVAAFTVLDSPPSPSCIERRQKSSFWERAARASISTGVKLVVKSKLPIRLTSRQATGEVLLRTLTASRSGDQQRNRTQQNPTGS